MPENTCTVSAGYTLESISRAIGDDVLIPIYEFIQPKLGSDKWIERYIGMIGFGSIIDGPNPASIATMIQDV